MINCDIIITIYNSTLHTINSIMSQLSHSKTMYSGFSIKGLYCISLKVHQCRACTIGEV